MAILGDSYSTGAGLVEGFHYEADSFWQHLKSPHQTPFEPLAAATTYTQQHPSEGPIWLPSSPREWQSGLSALTWSFMRKIATEFIDEPRHSWGYLLARRYGIPTRNIWIGAQDGATTADLLSQIERLLHYNERQLPSYTFALFTLGGLCASTIAEIQDVQSYQNEILRALKYLYINTTPRKDHTIPKVYLLSPLSLPAILGNPAILNKQVTAHGESVSCQVLRQRSFLSRKEDSSHQHPESQIFGHILPPNPAHDCPRLTVLTLPRRYTSS
ncbi:MAG: hypothetical protein OXT67_11050, partial [Zetaproteobacteria bacterium]|nr:hypothetical protein [Zetaproteobacteria bacterium]